MNESTVWAWIGAGLTVLMVFLSGIVVGHLWYKLKESRKKLDRDVEDMKRRLRL